MRYFIAFMCAMLIGSAAFAQTTTLTEEERSKIGAKFIPDKIEVNISQDQENRIVDNGAIASCKLILPQGLNKNPKCCEDKQCRESFMQERVRINKKYCLEYGGDEPTCSDPDSARAFVIKYRETHAKKSSESKRDEINRKYCLEYGYAADICDDPSWARQMVIDYRKQQAQDSAEAQKQRDITAREEAGKTALITEQAKRDAEEARRVLEQAKREAENIRANGAYKSDLPPLERRSHFLDMGLGFAGHFSGAVGGGLTLDYRPPLAGDRLVLGLAAGSLVVVRNRLEIGNFDPVTRLYGEASLSYRLVNTSDFSLALGGTFHRLGRFSLDKLTASMFGPTAVMKVGSLRLAVSYVYNTGPFNGYLEPGWGIMTTLSFDFLQTNLAGPSKYRR